MNCPQCKNVLRSEKKGIVCSCGYFIPRIIRNRIISDTIFEKLFKDGKTEFISGFHKKGSDETFSAKLVLKKNGTVGFTLEDSCDLSCPSCDAPLFEIASGFKCSSKNCHFLITWKMGGTKLTNSEIKSLIIFGETEPIHRFISPKTGSKYSATIFLDEKYLPKFKKI